MTIIIAGGRDYYFTEQDIAALDAIHKETPITEVVSGGAKGADLHGERWAFRNRIPVRKFPPEWRTHGLAAGPMRNTDMAEYAKSRNGACVLFPGGDGTNDMYRKAKKAGLKIYDFRGGL